MVDTKEAIEPDTRTEQQKEQLDAQERLSIGLSKDLATELPSGQIEPQRVAFKETVDTSGLSSIASSDGRTLIKTDDGSWTMSYRAGGQDKSVSVSNVDLKDGALAYDIQSNGKSVRVTELANGTRIVVPTKGEEINAPKDLHMLGGDDKDLRTRVPGAADDKIFGKRTLDQKTDEDDKIFGKRTLDQKTGDDDKIFGKRILDQKIDDDDKIFGKGTFDQKTGKDDDKVFGTRTLDHKIYRDEDSFGLDKRNLKDRSIEDIIKGGPKFLEEPVQEKTLPDGTHEIKIRNADGEAFRVLTDARRQPVLVETPTGNYRRDGEKWTYEPGKGSAEGPRTFKGSVQVAPDGQISIKMPDGKITYGIDGAKTIEAKDGSRTIEKQVADPREIRAVDALQTTPLKESCKYGQEGDLQRRTLKDGNGQVVLRTDVEKQDNGGRKEHTVSFDTSGKRSVSDTHYDSDGIKTKSVDLAADGKTPLKETQYDESGKVTRQIEYQGDGKTLRSEITFGPTGSEKVEFAADGKTKAAITVIDEAGKCTKKQEFSSDKPGEEKLTRERILVGEVEHDIKYGADGKRVSESRYYTQSIGAMKLDLLGGLTMNEMDRGIPFSTTEFQKDGVTKKREVDRSPSAGLFNSKTVTEFNEKGEPTSKVQTETRPQWGGTIKTERQLDLKTGVPLKGVSYYEREGISTRTGEETFYENGKTKSVCAYDTSGKIKMAEAHFDPEGHKLSQTSFRSDGKTPLIRQYYDKNGTETAIEGFDEQGNSTGAIDCKTKKEFPIPKTYDHDRFSVAYNPDLQRMTLIDGDGSIKRSIDTNGKEYIHRLGKEYPDEKIHPLKEMYNPKLPYEDESGKRNEGGEALHQRAEELLKEAAGPGGEIDFPAHGKMLSKISEMADLTEAEKLYVYERILAGEAEGRDPHSKPTEGALRVPGEGRYRLVNRGNQTPLSGKGDFVRHVAISPTNDGYHGSLVYGGGTTKEQALRGFQDGEDGIEAHERIKQGLKILMPIAKAVHPELNLIPQIRESDFGWKAPQDHYDSGDAAQSKAQIDAIRSFQDGGFAGYANKWNDNFVQPDLRKKR